MPRFSKAAALYFLLLAGSMAVAADTPPEPRRGPSAMIAELLELSAGETKQLEKLYEQFATSSDEESAMAIQRRIEALKRSTEIQILGVQLRHAREDARLEDIRQLEDALSVLRTPASDSE